MSEDGVLLRVRRVSKFYPGSHAAAPAVDDVSLSVRTGTVTGIVGESGSGKTTLARIMAGLLRPGSGDVTFDGTSLGALGAGALRKVRRHLQYVHQDPAAALNPRFRVRAILHEPLRIHTRLRRGERDARVGALLEAVGLSPALLERFPHELSGGQQRRVGLARVLVLEPRLVILDEPTAGLDLLVQSALLALLQELRERLALTYVVVTHDIAVVEALCDEMITMFRGCVVEQGSTDRVLRAPAHPYTRDLLSATLTMDGPRVTDQARWQLVSPETSQSATGCPFLARCDMAVARCTHERPPLAHRDGREVACWVIPATNSPAARIATIDA